jgi:hypothetical protein
MCCLHTYRRDNILELAWHGLACTMSLLSLRCFFLIAVLKMEQQVLRTVWYASECQISPGLTIGYVGFGALMTFNHFHQRI